MQRNEIRYLLAHRRGKTINSLFPAIFPLPMQDSSPFASYKVSRKCEMLKITTAQEVDTRQIAMRIQTFQQFLQSTQQQYEDLAHSSGRSNQAQQRVARYSELSNAFEQAGNQLNALVQTVHPRPGFENWNSAPVTAPDFSHGQWSRVSSKDEGDVKC